MHTHDRNQWRSQDRWGSNCCIVDDAKIKNIQVVGVCGAFCLRNVFGGLFACGTPKPHFENPGYAIDRNVVKPDIYSIRGNNTFSKILFYFLPQQWRSHDFQKGFGAQQAKNTCIFLFFVHKVEPQGLQHSP